VSQCIAPLFLSLTHTISPKLVFLYACVHTTHTHNIIPFTILQRRHSYAHWDSCTRSNIRWDLYDSCTLHTRWDLYDSCTLHTLWNMQMRHFVCLRTHYAYAQCNTRHHPAMTTLIRTLGLMYTLIDTLGFIWLTHTTHTVKSADASTPSACKRQRQSGCGSADTTDDSLIRSEQGGEGCSDISSQRGD